MRRIIASVGLGLIFCLYSFILMDMVDVIRAFRNGDADLLYSGMDNTVEIVMAGKNHTYSKPQAAGVMHDFFNTKKVKDFVVSQKSTSGITQFCTGTLETQEGDYRTTVVLRQKNNNLVIQEIKLIPL